MPVASGAALLLLVCGVLAFCVANRRDSVVQGRADTHAGGNFRHRDANAYASTKLRKRTRNRR